MGFMPRCVEPELIGPIPTAWTCPLPTAWTCWPSVAIACPAMSSPSPSPGKIVHNALSKMRLATNRPEWMKAKKVTASLSLTAEAPAAASSGLSLAAEATTAASSGQCASTLEPKPGNLPWFIEDDEPSDDEPSQPSLKKKRTESVLDSLIEDAQPKALCCLCNKMTSYCTCPQAPVTPIAASGAGTSTEAPKTPKGNDQGASTDVPKTAKGNDQGASTDAPKTAKGNDQGASTDAPKTAKGNEPVTPGDGIFPQSPVAYFEQIIQPKLGPSASLDKVKDSLMEWVPERWVIVKKDLPFPTYDDLRVMAPIGEVQYGNTLLHSLAESRPKEGVRLMLKRKDSGSGKVTQMGSMVFKPREEVDYEYPKLVWLYLDCLQIIMMFCKHWESSPEDIRSYHAQLKEVLPEATSLADFLAEL